MTPTPLEIALERIEECRRTRSTKLDLRELYLDVIPDAVFELTWLEKLKVLGGGRIREIPAAIRQLTGLTELSVVANNISPLHVPNLTSLNYEGNLQLGRTELTRCPREQHDPLDVAIQIA